MFENLSGRLTQTFRRLSGKGQLKEPQVKEALKEIRKALLDADVASAAVKEFIQTIREKAIGHTVATHLSSEQAFLKLVNEQLVELMGESHVGLELKVQPPAIILVAGLQGAGKTTTVAKIAKWLQETQKKTVALVSCDVYRPAAIDQLRTLSLEIQSTFIESDQQQKPTAIVQQAIQEAKRQQQEVLIIDTAGRLHVDNAMMDEIKALCKLANPAEVLFVVDSMTGQDAAKSALAFGEALPLTGVVLTKMDGDARGGSALSVRYVTGKPIKFIGMGEKLDALEAFHPERIASRILGMGDLLTLIEEVERKSDKEKNEKLAKKIQKGQGFDLNDLREQMKQMVTMGGMANLMDKLPGAGQLSNLAKSKVNDKELVRSIAILDSMTAQERRFPASISTSGSRKRRISVGSGMSIQQVNRVLKQHEQMQKMMKKMSGKGGVTRMMRGLQGRLPPGMLPPSG